MPWDSLTDIQQRIDKCIDGFSQCILDLNQSGNIWRSTNFRCQATRPVRLPEYWSYMYMMELLDQHCYLLQLQASQPPNLERVHRSAVTLEMVLRDIALHLVSNLLDRQSAYTIRFHGYKPFIPWRFWIRSTGYAPPPHTFQDDDAVLDLENTILWPIFRPLCIREQLIDKCIEAMHSVTLKGRNASHLCSELLSLAKELAEAQHDFEHVLWEHSELRRRTFVSNYVPTPFKLEKIVKFTPGKGKAKDSPIKVLKDSLEWVPVDGAVPPSDRATSWVRWWYSAMQPKADEEAADLVKIRHLLYHLDGRITNMSDSFVNMEYSLANDVQKVLLNQLQKYHNRMQDLKNFHDSLVHPYPESDNEFEEGEIADGTVGNSLGSGPGRRNKRWGHLECYQLLRQAHLGGYLSRTTLPDLEHIANHFLHHLNKHGLIHVGSPIDNGVIFRAAMQFTVLTKSRNRQRATQQLSSYRNQDLEEIDNLLAQEGPSSGTSDPSPEPPGRPNASSQGRGHSHTSNFQSAGGRTTFRAHATVDQVTVTAHEAYEELPPGGRTIQTLFEEAVCERFAKRAAERITQSLGVKATVECRSPSQTPPPEYQSNVTSRDATPVHLLQTPGTAASEEDEPYVPPKQQNKPKSTQKQKKPDQQKTKDSAVADSKQGKEKKAASPDVKTDDPKAKTTKSDIQNSNPTPKPPKGQKGKSKIQSVEIKSAQEAVIQTKRKETSIGSDMKEPTKCTKNSESLEDDEDEVFDTDNQPKVSKRKQKKMNRINRLNQKKEIVINIKKKQSCQMAEANTPKKKEDAKAEDKIRPTKESVKEGDKMKSTKDSTKDGDKMRPTKEGAKGGDKMRPTKEGVKEGEKTRPTKEGAKEGDKTRPTKEGAKEEKTRPTKEGAKEGDKTRPTKEGAKEGDDNNNNLNKDKNHPNGKRMHAVNQGLKMEKHLMARGPSLRSPQQVVGQGKMTPSCAGAEHSRTKRSTFLAGSRGEKRLTAAEGKEDASNAGKEKDKKSRKISKSNRKLDEEVCNALCTCSDLDSHSLFWELLEPGQWQSMDIWPRIMSLLEDGDSDIFPCFDPRDDVRYALSPEEIDKVFDTAVLGEEEFCEAFLPDRVSSEVSNMFDTELVQAVILTALLDDKFKRPSNHRCFRRLLKPDMVKLKQVVDPMLCRLVTLAHIDTRSKRFMSMVAAQKRDFLYLIKLMAETFSWMSKIIKPAGDGTLGSNFYAQCCDILITLFKDTMFHQLRFFEMLLEKLSRGRLDKDQARISRDFHEYHASCQTDGNLQFPPSDQGVYTLILHDVYSTATAHLRDVKKTQAFARIPRETSSFLARPVTTVTTV